MKLLLKYSIYIGLGFLFKPISCSRNHSENMEVKFPGMYISIGQTPMLIRLIVRSMWCVFMLKWEPGKKDRGFSPPSKQYLNHSRKSKRLQSESSILAAAYQRRQSQNKRQWKKQITVHWRESKIGANHPAGVYTSTIPFEVNYNEAVYLMRSRLTFTVRFHAQLLIAPLVLF